MSYRTPLEHRLAKKVTQAIIEFGLIEDGDRVMVGLSGGKDSWALMQILDVLRKRAPIDFSLVAVNVNSGYTELPTRPGHRAPAPSAAGSATSSTRPSARSWTTSSTTATRRARCARGCAAACSTGWRRRSARRRSRSAITSTTSSRRSLLNLFFQGSLKAMPARLVSDIAQAHRHPPARVRHRSRGAQPTRRNPACR